MIIENLVSLAGETFARAEWVALFLGVVGLYWFTLAFNGVRLSHTRGFGWRAAELHGDDAQLAGILWGTFAGGCLVAAIIVWILKARGPRAPSAARSHRLRHN